MEVETWRERHLGVSNDGAQQPLRTHHSYPCKASALILCARTLALCGVTPDVNSSVSSLRPVGVETLPAISSFNSHLSVSPTLQSARLHLMLPNRRATLLSKATHRIQCFKDRPRGSHCVMRAYGKLASCRQVPNSRLLAAVGV